MSSSSISKPLGARAPGGYGSASARPSSEMAAWHSITYVINFVLLILYIIGMIFLISRRRLSEAIACRNIVASILVTAAAVIDNINQYINVYRGDGMRERGERSCVVYGEAPAKMLRLKLTLRLTKRVNQIIRRALALRVIAICTYSGSVGDI